MLKRFFVDGIIDGQMMKHPRQKLFETLSQNFNVKVLAIIFIKGTVEDEELSLDNIEHDIMRENWDEPRVHYAVNCASYGCPNLALEPFTGKKLEAQLEKAAKDYVNHPRGVSFDGNKLTISKIYDWYGKDFGATKAAQLKSIAKHADPDLADKLKAHSGRVSYEYDWSLNDTANGPDGS